MVTELNDSNFDSFVGSRSVALIDFYATWCGPCTQMAPIIEQTATKYADTVAVGKVNVDLETNQELTSRLGISALPTFLFFKDGQIVETVCGAIPLIALEQQVDALLD